MSVVVRGSLSNPARSSFKAVWGGRGLEICLCTKERTYVVGIGEELLDIWSGRMIADEFDESTTLGARFRTSIGKSGECFLRVEERSMQGLRCIRKARLEVLLE